MRRNSAVAVVVRPTARLNAGFVRLVRSVGLDWCPFIPLGLTTANNCVCSDTRMSSDRASIVEAPRAELGDLVDEYISWVMCEVEEFRQCNYGRCDGHQKAITALIQRDGRAAVAPFFEPLDVSYFRTLRFFSGDAGTFSIIMEKGIVNSGSAVEQMEAFNKYFEEQERYHELEEEYDTIPELEWLVKHLKNAMKD